MIFQRYPLVCAMLAFAAGIVCSAVLVLPLEPAGIPSPLCRGLLPLAIVGMAFLLQRPHRLKPIGRPAVSIVLTLATVAGLLQGARELTICLPEQLVSTAPVPDEPVWFTGTVSRRPAVRFDDTALIVDLELAETAPIHRPCACRVQVRFPTPAVPEVWSADPIPQRGQRIRFFAWLRRPLEFQNPGRFDYPRHLAAGGVSHTARLKSSRLIQPLSPPGKGAVVTVRRWVERTVRSRFAFQDSEGLTAPGALLLACLTGNRRWVDPQDEEQLRCSGLGHLLAISGLHLGLLGLVLSGLLSLFRVPIRLRRPALIAFFLFYRQLVGGTPSINRALITVVVYLAGRMLGTRPVPGNSLAAAGLSMLALSPLMLHDAGFLLTFGASYSILTLAPMLTAAINTRAPALSRAVSTAVGLPAVSAAVLLGIAPLQAALFHQATPAVLLTNLAAGPLLGLSLVAGLALLAGECISALLPPVLHPLLEALSQPASGIVEFGFASILSLAGRTAPYSFRLPGPSLPVCALYYGCLAAAVLLSRQRGQGRRRRWARLLIIAAPCLLLVGVCLGGRSLPERTIRITFLDVGQGDSAIVESSSGNALVIDGGGALPGGFDFGERVVSPALWRLGRHRLEAVAVSHGHQDHAGGLASVVRNFHPRSILAGRRLDRCAPSVIGLLRAGERHGARLAALCRGRVIRVGSAEIVVLHPPPALGPPPAEEGLGPNNDSLVLLLRHGKVKILFTGDLESEGEEVLLRSPLAGLIAGCDLLKAGHHGAPGASSARWLRLVSPRTAVITAGRLNRFGHPDPALYRRLRDAGCRRIHCTGHDGALTVVSDGRRLYHRTDVR